MTARGADETRWLSQEEREAWLAVVALMIKLPPALDSQLRTDAGLSFFEYMVLAMVSEQPDRSLQMSDIADLASASLSRLSHTVTRLEKQGLLVRHRVPGHGRRFRAVLTDAGLEKVAAAAPPHVMEVRRLLIDDLTDHELTVLTTVGRRVLGRLAPDCPA